MLPSDRPRERPLRVAVCGAGDADPTSRRLAAEVGARLAQAGAVLVCGGRGGAMEAAAEGARNHGGITIGVLPGSHAAEANDWITLPLPTGMGEARNILVIRFADAVIAIGGEWGTMSEIALARKIGTPVVLLAPTLARGLPIDAAETPQEAVAWALREAAARHA